MKKCLCSWVFPSLVDVNRTHFTRTDLLQSLFSIFCSGGTPKPAGSTHIGSFWSQNRWFTGEVAWIARIDIWYKNNMCLGQVWAELVGSVETPTGDEALVTLSSIESFCICCSTWCFCPDGRRSDPTNYHHFYKLAVHPEKKCWNECM